MELLYRWRFRKQPVRRSCWLRWRGQGGQGVHVFPWAAPILPSPSLSHRPGSRAEGWAAACGCPRKTHALCDRSGGGAFTWDNWGNAAKPHCQEIFFLQACERHAASRLAPWGHLLRCWPAVLPLPAACSWCPAPPTPKARSTSGAEALGLQRLSSDGASRVHIPVTQHLLTPTHTAVQALPQYCLASSHADLLPEFRGVIWVSGEVAPSSANW